MPNRTLPQVAVSTAFHRTLRHAARFFGGRYGELPPTVRPPDVRVVDLGKITLRVLCWEGRGVPIVLLHGLNNNAWSWARVATQLTPRPVFAVNQRGHGGSSAPPSDYRLETCCHDLLALLDQLGLDRVDLGGHSWGGKVATFFAARHTERVVSLTLADPAPPRGLNGLIRAAPVLTTASLRAERGPFPTREAWREAGLSVIYLRHWDAIDRSLWEEGFETHSDESLHHRLPESGFQEILRVAIAQNIEPVLSGITAPILMLRPTFTLSFLPGELTAMRRALPQMVEGRIAGDHTFIHTNPMDTAAAMREFLQLPR